MKANFLNLCLIIVISTLFSCSKGESPIGSPGNDLIYYDFYSSDVSYPPNNDSMTSERVCYDLNNQKIVWRKRNQKLMREYNWEINVGSAYGFAYSRAFIKGNYVIKITPATNYPADALMPVEGIYFEKIDKSTGDQLVLKKLVSATEIINSKFIMSQVVTDGDRYFFACNNNSIYCCSSNGDILWKKDNYPMSNIGNYGYMQFSFIYYDDGYIYFATTDAPTGWKIVVCLDASTGIEKWRRTSSAYPCVRQFVFTKNLVLDLDQWGYASTVDKLTGEQGGPFPASGSSIYPLAWPIGKLNDSAVLYFNTDGNIGLHFFSHPSQIPWIVLSNENLTIDHNFIFTNQRILGGSRDWTNSRIFFCTVDCNSNGGVVWKKSFPFNAQNQLSTVYNYFLKNNKLYLVTNFTVENGQCKVVPLGTASVIILDPTDGNLIKQISGLPATTGSFYSFGLYNISAD